MRATVRPLMAAVFVLFVAGCQRDVLSPPSSNDANSDPELISQGIIATAGWSATAPIFDVDPVEASRPLQAWGREHVVGDVAHYWFSVRVGFGTYDIIRIHRVVREERPFQPIRTGLNLFLLHGDYKDFEGCFLPGTRYPRVPESYGFATFLAQNGVDVWGIDQAWTLVPETAPDLSFMADWGLPRQVRDLRTAITVAAVTRKLMGNPSRKVHLCGYSSGSTVGFALLDQESQLPPGRRIVDGFIGVDQGVVTDVSSWEESMCGVVESYQALIDSGQFQDYNPLPFFGLPARDDPNGMSEIPGFEGLTNLQAGLALGAYPFFPPDTGHFLSAVLDEDELPIGLLYTTVDWWVDFMVDSPPYEPCAFLRDEYITSCPAAGDVPWDDHLGDIRNPVLYVSAGGGFGYTGAYTLDLLGSPDVSELLVSVTTDPFFDVAHVDLFLANDTPALFWQPVLEWVDEHSR